MEIVGKGVTLAFLFTSYFILPLNEAVGNIMPGRGNVAIELAYLEAALSHTPKPAAFSMSIRLPPTSSAVVKSTSTIVTFLATFLHIRMSIADVAFYAASV